MVRHGAESELGASKGDAVEMIAMGGQRVLITCSHGGPGYEDTGNVGVMRVNGEQQ